MIISNLIHQMLERDHGQGCAGQDAAPIFMQRCNSLTTEVRNKNQDFFIVANTMRQHNAVHLHNTSLLDGETTLFLNKYSHSCEVGSMNDNVKCFNKCYLMVWALYCSSPSPLPLHLFCLRCRFS